MIKYVFILIFWVILIYKYGNRSLHSPVTSLYGDYIDVAIVFIPQGYLDEF